MLSRRNFIHKGMIASGAAMLGPYLSTGYAADEIIMTINGPISPAKMGFTQSHEHVLADFGGAGTYSKDRYDADEVYNIALPFLLDLKSKGCVTFVDCSPAYLGRDVKIFKRLAKATGLNFITNTGYYGAVGEKFLPKHAYTETAAQLSTRWTKEFTDGIEGTGIKPGFIKTSCDKAPLTPTQRKIIEAAALTHLATGLTIAIHTGNGDAAREELSILKSVGVSPSARIWVHSQNEPDMTYHIETAKQNGWVAFDGVNPETMDANLGFLQRMKKENLLDYVLVAQDSGWYNVGEPKGGNFKDYNCILTQFIPLLKRNGFTQAEVDTFFVTNPAKAFAIKVRPHKS